MAVKEKYGTFNEQLVKHQSPEIPDETFPQSLELFFMNIWGKAHREHLDREALKNNLEGDRMNLRSTTFEEELFGYSQSLGSIGGWGDTTF